MARRPPGTELDALIGQYQHESQRPRAAEALLILRKVGSIVKPIMRQRSWHVGTLAEFYPSQSNLLGLNINHGQKINLRLRHAGDSNQFLRFEDVVDTMLHELCHNVIGPHNQQFHALWDQLRDEHEALLRKGYTGEGFLGRGQSLGGQRIPRHEANRLARQAAEQRRIRNQGSGQRLGGTGILRGQDARAVIADAVERRLRIERGCASGTEAGDKAAQDDLIKLEEVTTTQAGPDDENEATIMQAFIDLIQEEEKEKFGGYYSPPSAENPAGPRGQNMRPDTARASVLVRQQKEIEASFAKSKSKNSLESSTGFSRRRQRAPSKSLSDSSASSRTVTPDPPPISTSRNPTPPPRPAAPSTLNTWTCEICTLINPSSFLSCDACGVERPPASTSPLHDEALQDPQSRPAKKLKETPNALKPRTSAYDSIQRFERERAQKIDRAPMGWRCRTCGNFMEAEWWTCAGCGRMKESS